jgi:hypothetical protein
MPRNPNSLGDQQGKKTSSTGRTTSLSLRFKITVIVLCGMMFVFLGVNVFLVLLIASPSPSQNSLIDNTSRAWQTLLGGVLGVFTGKLL